MSLNIKNEETHQLAKELAAITGEEYDRRYHSRAQGATGT